MPGVLIVEAMAQVGRDRLLGVVPEKERKLLYLSGWIAANSGAPSCPETSSGSRRRSFPEDAGLQVPGDGLGRTATSARRRSFSRFWWTARDGSLGPSHRDRLGGGGSRRGGRRSGPTRSSAMGSRSARGSAVGAHVSLKGPRSSEKRTVSSTTPRSGSTRRTSSTRGEPTRLVVGSRNVFASSRPRTAGTARPGETVIGDENYFMNYAHVAHDNRIGSRVVMANSAVLAGHVEVGNQRHHRGLRRGPPVLSASAPSRSSAYTACRRTCCPSAAPTG